jgi:hypothetical protein
MFDTARNNNNQQQQQQNNVSRGNGNNGFFPQTPSGWNPLNSININVNDDHSQKAARLPVFSTLSK